ncbi:MAG TPA: alpha/beta fold hydrolase [Bacteroidales bacterium]|nr:alpha/beta fold hydrolase [Bacteroidales bacterium]
MDLKYRKYGSGPAIVLLHGLFGLGDNWVTIARGLEKNHTVYAPDLRNHGFSPYDNAMTYDAMASDVEMFLETHQIQNPLLIGHSMGGKVAMQFCAENPEVPAGLIVLDISPLKYQARPEHLKILNAMQQINLEKYSSRNDIQQVVNQHIENIKIRQVVMKNLVRTDQGFYRWKPNVAVIRQEIDALFAAVRRPEKPLPFPVLFIQGGDSDYLGEADRQEILDFWSAKIITLPGASHWLHAEAPEKVLSEINKFSIALNSAEY